MKRVVISDDFKEFEIHPPELFDKYLEITEKELGSLLKKWDLFDINCPACDSQKKEIMFNKFGMEYAECKNCKTLFVTPRPSDENIQDYHKSSKAMSFWKEHFYKETVFDRKRIMFRPRALWVVNVTENYFNKPEWFIDVKSKYVEFIEEIRNLDLFENNIILDPLIDANRLPKREEGLEVVNKKIEVYSKEFASANAISALEVIDRMSNPEQFIKNARSMLVDDGLLFLTASAISGFDLQILWDRSKSIFPLDHINLFSIEGITKLLEKNGFEIIELSTPGQLDLEIVKNAMKTYSDLKLPRFISYLIEKRDENAHREFQDFLQRFNLSSHLRIAAQKK